MQTHTVDYFPENMGKVIGLDIETTSRYGGKISDPFRDDILSIAVSNGEQSWVVSNPDGYASIVPHLERPDELKVVHNAAFEWQFLMHKLGAKPNKDSIYDSLLAERIINAGQPIYVRNGLEDATARHLGVILDKSTRASFYNHSGEFSEEQLKYIVEDVLYLPALYEKQMQVISDKRLGRVVRLENRLTVVVAEMTLNGVCFDMDLWNQYAALVAPKLAELKREMADYLGLARQLSIFDDNIEIGVNLNSTSQISAMLARLGINVFNTREETLVEFMQKNPGHKHIKFLRLLLDGWRMWSKMGSVDYVQHINPETGLIHPSWNQIKADTGRFSCSDPNLQNVRNPDKDPNVPNHRLLFPPKPGYVFVVSDFNQHEPRILAEASEDEALRRAARKADVYCGMGTEVYEEEITKKDPRRDLMKTVVLASFYGGGAEGIAKRTGVPQKDVEKIQKILNVKFKRAASYARKQKTFAMQQGYVRTLLGRIRHIDIHQSEGRVGRQAVNTPIQGTGADMLKMGMDVLHDAINERGYDAYINLQIHDELVVAVREDQAEEVKYQVIGAMEKSGYDLCPNVITIAEAKIFDRWRKN
jgi:DNA polymerase I